MKICFVRTLSNRILSPGSLSISKSNYRKYRQWTTTYVRKTTRVWPWDLFLEIQKIIFDASISLFWWFDFSNWETTVFFLDETKYFETCLTFEQKYHLVVTQDCCSTFLWHSKVLFIFSNLFPITVLFHRKTDDHSVKGMVNVVGKGSRGNLEDGKTFQRHNLSNYAVHLHFPTTCMHLWALIMNAVGYKCPKSERTSTFTEWDHPDWPKSV